jgi:hypothetical protein
VAATHFHPESIDYPLQGFDSPLGILPISGLQNPERFFDLGLHLSAFLDKVCAV